MKRNTQKKLTLRNNAVFSRIKYKKLAVKLSNKHTSKINQSNV